MVVRANEKYLFDFVYRNADTPVRFYRDRADRSVRVPDLLDFPRRPFILDV